MSKKIQDIKKKEAQHVDIQQETTGESHISVHRDAEKKEDTDFENKKIDTTIEREEESEKKAEVVKEKNTTKKDIAASIKEKEKKEGPINIVFMGTGLFAGNILEEMIKQEKYSIIEIVTQPDKKIGRKKSSIHRTLAPNPVRDVATVQNISLFQPEKITNDTIAHIKKKKPDVIIVASYGKILPKTLLDIPEFGAINVHTSLLPQLRGASPAQNALLLGSKETGVTIIQMDEGLDTGDILGQEKTPIEEHEKSDALLDRLSKIGAKLLIDIVLKLQAGEVTPQPQEHSKATLCQLIDREDGHIQWTQTTEEIYNRYRALHPWPGIFSYWEETQNQMMRIKLRAINPYKEKLTDVEEVLSPGTVFIGRDQLCIKTFDSAVIIEALQPECKAIMPIYDFLNGHKSFEGAVLR